MKTTSPNRLRYSCRRTARALALSAGVLVCSQTNSAHAVVTHSASGFSSAGVAVSFEAQLTISGNTLTVVLCNKSSSNTANPADLLGSYYFDIVNGMGMRPTLTYTSATGDVYLTNKNAPDTLQTASDNLLAAAAGDNDWQFKSFNPAQAPFLGFGVGTVGNSNLSPNNFNGNIVGGMDYAIYAGDITTNNLDGRLLVKNCITFTFSGVSGFTEQNIRPGFAFGMGTAPDSLLVPTPGVAGMLALAGLTAARRRRS